jgi:hypothetical protein
VGRINGWLLTPAPEPPLTAYEAGFDTWRNGVRQAVLDETSRYVTTHRPRADQRQPGRRDDAGRAGQHGGHLHRAGGMNFNGSGVCG